MGNNSTRTSVYLKYLTTDKQQNYVPKKDCVRYITVNRPTLHTDDNKYNQYIIVTLLIVLNLNDKSKGPNNTQ